MMLESMFALRWTRIQQNGEKIEDDEDDDEDEDDEGKETKEIGVAERLRFAEKYNLRACADCGNWFHAVSKSVFRVVLRWIEGGEGKRGRKQSCSAQDLRIRRTPRRWYCAFAVSAHNLRHGWQTPG